MCKDCGTVVCIHYFQRHKHGAAFCDESERAYVHMSDIFGILDPDDELGGAPSIVQISNGTGRVEQKGAPLSLVGIG